MAIITPSSTIVFGKFSFGQKRADIDEVSEPSGAVSTRLLGPPRWRLSVMSPPKLSLTQIGIWQPMVMNLRGRVNHLAMWDVGQPAPVGTMRGTMTLNGAVVAGAVTASVSGGGAQASTTLKANDWLQIGTGLTSQLVCITADATANASGIISTTFEPPLRIGYAGGTAVTWDRPVAHYKAMGGSGMIDYDPGYLTKGSIALDLLEQWT